MDHPSSWGVMHLCLVLANPHPRYNDLSRGSPHFCCADIGTSSSQWGDGKNWSDGPDVCMNNVVRNNEIRTNVRHNTTVLHPVVHRNETDHFEAITKRIVAEHNMLSFFV